MPGTDIPWILTELRRALEALSLDGEAALATTPPGSRGPDELALDYEHFLRAALSTTPTSFSPEPESALRRTETLLAAMSEVPPGERRELWTENAVRFHTRWKEVRDSARRARILMGWEESVLC